MFFFFILILIFLFLIGIPVAISIGITPVFIMWLFSDQLQINYSIIAHRLVGGVDSFVLLSIPFFLLVGKLMNTGGITDRIFNFARGLVGHLKGGLGHVNVVASLIFSGITGTAASDVAGLGAVEIKAMEESGYDTEFAAAITGASATVGPIIPPSLPMIIYGVLATVSVGRLLIGGLLPGLLLGLLLIIMVAYYAKKYDYPREAKASWSQRIKLFLEGFPALLTPVILIGGIFWGAFTPTEAAAVAVLYSLVLGLITKELNIRIIWEKLQEAMLDSAVIGIIIAAAAVYGWFLVRLSIPDNLVQLVTGVTDSKIVVLLLLNLFFLSIGSFLETIAALTIFVPIVVPVLTTFQIDPLHFGVVLVFNLMIGLLTPPFGINLFILSRITGKRVEELIVPVAKFLGVLIFVLLIITFIPEIVTWLPTTLM